MRKGKLEKTSEWFSAPMCLAEFKSNLLYFGDRLLLLDTDGNRFDFSDVRALDERSRALPDGIL